MKRTARATWIGRGALVPSLVLIVPLLLAYDLGLLLAARGNGVDLLSGALLALCAGSVALYLLLHAGLAAGFLWWARRTGNAASLSLAIVGPLVVEAMIYALTLGAVIAWIVHDGLGLGASRGSAITALVTSLGAGVHEELLFRLGAFAGGAALLRRVGLAPRAAWTVALIVSSLLFALAHHHVVGHEPLVASTFAFRAVAGAAFALICWYRSLAHAVYAHVLYDVYVLLIQ
jgi:hypothetical protein